MENLSKNHLLKLTDQQEIKKTVVFKSLGVYSPPLVAKLAKAL